MRRLPSVNAATLRRLLALARDLLQAPDATSVLALAGPVIQELLMADGALLLVALRGQEYVTEFDQSGLMQPARKETALCQYARRAMDNQTPILLLDVATDSNVRANGLSIDGTASLLAYPFPPIKPVGVLAAFWYRKGHQDQLAKQMSTLRFIGELPGAALGNVGFRQGQWRVPRPARREKYHERELSRHRKREAC